MQRKARRAETSHSLQVRGLWGNLAKAAVQFEVKSTHAATDLMAAESPLCRMLRGARMSALKVGSQTFDKIKMSFCQGFVAQVSSLLLGGTRAAAKTNIIDTKPLRSLWLV